MGELYTGERFVPSECDDEMQIEHMQRYQLAAGLCVNKKVVLDTACGEGYGSAYLSYYASKVIGVDIDLETI